MASDKEVKRFVHAAMTVAYGALVEVAKSDPLTCWMMRGMLIDWQKMLKKLADECGEPAYFQVTRN